MSSDNLEAPDDLSRGSFCREVAAETRSHGGEDEVDTGSPLVYHIVPHSITCQDVLMRLGGTTGHGSRKVLDAQDICVKKTAKELKHQLRLDSLLGTGSSV